MEIDRFERMVARLEAESAASPGPYQFKVALLALLGFLILAGVLGAAGFGMLLLLGLALLLVFKGGAAVLLLLKLGKLLFVLAVPLWFLVRSSMRALFVRLPPPQGEPLSREQAPALFEAIDGMRRRLKGPPVHRVLLVDEMNAFIVQRPLFGLIGWPRNHLVLGLPLLDSMRPEEALAVVAHEYGHLAGAHGRFGAFIYRLRLSWATIDAVAAHWQGWVGRWLQRVVGWYAPYFNAYTFVLARANEYQADRASADLVGPEAAAAALKRSSLAGAHFEAFLGRTFEALGDTPQPPADLLQRWAGISTHACAEPQAPRWLAAALDRERGLLDTHPSLRDRLAALPGGAGAIDTLPPLPEGASAAQAWLGPAQQALRERFQAAWVERVGEAWQQRHQQWQADRARLAALRGQAECSVPEQLERLRLQARLEPEADTVAELAAFNATQPDHAPALFLEGSLRLDRDDDAGIALVERAMALDADAIKPGCERLHAFLAARKDPRAPALVQRWRERDALEQARAQQLARLDTSHALAAAELDDDKRAAVQAALGIGLPQGVRALYFVRRVLPADPACATYVLGVELDWWSRRRKRHPAVVEALVRREWPVHLFVCTLDGRPEAWTRALKAVPGSRLA